MIGEMLKFILLRCFSKKNSYIKRNHDPGHTFSKFKNTKIYERHVRRFCNKHNSNAVIWKLVKTFWGVHRWYIIFY